MITTPSVVVAASTTQPPEARDLYGIVKDHLKESLTKMSAISARQPLSLKQICSQDFWSSLSDGDRRQAGQYVAVMVRDGELQLAEVPHSHEYPKKYCSI